MPARSKRGLGAATSRGLNRKKIAKKGQGTGDRVVMKDGSTVPIQFYVGPDDFLEYEIHRFQEDGNWQIVPCVGDACPMCDDEQDAKSKTSYRFAAPVWNFEQKKSMVLEGPKDLAEKVLFRFDRLKNKSMFVKSTYEAIRFPTNPTTYGLDKGEEEPIKLKASDAKDVDAYVDNQIKNYYGDELPTASALDSDDSDDDDNIEDDDADTWTRKDLEKKSAKALEKIAKEEGVSAKDIKGADGDKDELIDLIIGGDDDDDDDSDDDDDDDGLDEMDRTELKKYIAENDLEVKVKKSMDDDDIREAIREAEGADDDDDDDDDED